MVNCIINFNNSNLNGVYYSGQEVSGSVTLHNEKPRLIRALLLKIEGYAQTRWSESSGTGSDSTSQTYSAREDYLNETTVLINSEPGERELEVGQHTFSFCFFLPLTIPSSFQNYYGDIVYQVKVEMDRRLKFNYTFMFPFTVITDLDLNYESVELTQPLKGEISKKFFLGFGSNALTVTAEIPFCGFVAGQTLCVDVKIVNDSSVKVEQVLVELYRRCLFKCDFSSTKTDSHLLVKGEHEGVAEKATSRMTVSLEIPPVEPTNARFCKYIVTNFELVVTAKVGGLHRSAYLRMPITIGTSPISKVHASGVSIEPECFDKLGFTGDAKEAGNEKN